MYIEHPEGNPFKSIWLGDLDGVLVYGSRAPILEGYHLVCIVNNGSFEAAKWIQNTADLSRFSIDDGRPKLWLNIPFEVFDSEVRKYCR